MISERRTFVAGVTVEAMLRVLAVHPRGLINVRDELAGWYNNPERYSGGGSRPYVIDRVKDNGVSIPYHE